jgi:hypothetical protein
MNMSMKKKQSLTAAAGIDDSSSYEDIRRRLVKHNFVILQLFAVTMNNIKKLSVKKPSPPRTKNKPEIDEQLRFYDFLLHLYYFGGEDIYKSYNDSLFVQKGGERLITEPGVYIRYHPKMTRKEWNNRYDQAIVAAKEQNIFAGIQIKEIPDIQDRHQVGTKDVEQNIEVYLKVEAKVPEYWHDRSRIYKDPVTEKVIRKLPVIDSVLEDVLTDENRDDETERKKLKAKYKDIYYDICRRYMLPTYTEFDKYTDLWGFIVAS